MLRGVRPDHDGASGLLERNEASLAPFRANGNIRLAD